MQIGSKSHTPVTIGTNTESALSLDGQELSIGDVFATKTHQTTHKWKGADELNIKDLMIFQPALYYAGFGSDGFWQSTTTSTGGSFIGYALSGVSTGATVSSQSGRVSFTGWFFQHGNPSFNHRSKTRISPSTITSQMDFWVGYFSSGTTYPTGTSNHIGFQLVSTDGDSADLYATNGDGTNNTRTLVLENVGQFASVDLGIKYITTGIEFYVNDTLATTHTTNRPNSVSLNPGFWISNSVAENREVYIFQVAYMVGSD